MAVIAAATATCVSNLVPNPKKSTAYFLVAIEPLERADLSLVTTSSQRESLKSGFSTADSPFNLQGGHPCLPVSNVSTHL